MQPFPMHSKTLLAIALVGFAAFQVANQFRLPASASVISPVANQVVIGAPLQVALYAGDRFLAADVEAIRVAAIGPSEEESLSDYRIRAQTLVSRLNACHEDNMYLSNAMLGWGGAVNENNRILERATKCRFWDYAPPFLLGFNRYFFNKDFDGAKKAINIAAERASGKNKTGLQKISIMIGARKLNDEKMALQYLRNERKAAQNGKLAAKLDKRIKRLEGLMTLRDAQARFEAKYGHPLKQPQKLLTSGILKSVPQDPMNLGYEFVDGHFRMRAVNIGGVEIR